jgi:hypothetical protein
MQGRYLLLRLARLEAACDYYDGSQAHARRSALVAGAASIRLSEHAGVANSARGIRQRRHFLADGSVRPNNVFGWMGGLCIEKHHLPTGNVSICDDSTMKKHLLTPPFFFSSAKAMRTVGRKRASQAKPLARRPPRQGVFAARPRSQTSPAAAGRGGGGHATAGGYVAGGG